MSRDWQKDMELLSNTKNYVERHGFKSEEENAAIYWLQQYAAEKERADKAMDEYKFLWNQATAAAEREMQLIEYIKGQGDEGKRFLEFIYGQIPIRTKPASLYPKEGETK